LKEGDKVSAKITNIDRKNRSISLSVKAKEAQEEADAIKDYTDQSATAATTFGDLFKDKM
ncbi:MAG: 30S ribosomal protein S1, partial [Gammaproteobacteria bacterium]|nr:30S ribosomal protein S1 [Gammaproteobacteria bacterium]